jgi:protocatechuate 3,4-dioxygenase beta subunit
VKRVPNADMTPDGPVFEGRLLARPEAEVVDQGAGFDINTLVTRRRLLGIAGAGAGALVIAACTGGSDINSGKPVATTSDGEIPQETNGPYPADGTNGVNILEESGIVRSDIRSSLDGGTMASGVPLTMSFTVTDMANSVPFAGAVVYLWQCDAEGRYSMYSEGVENETYLRGVQVADKDGTVTFTTIVPGCYDGRWTHQHFEIYPDLKSATNADNSIAISQVAFPEDILAEVYQDSRYPQSASNLKRVSLETDNVFSDGWELELGTFTGNVASGYVGTLAVGVDTRTEPELAAPPPVGRPGGKPPNMP